jgi:signal transduction histidine kinase
MPIRFRLALAFALAAAAVFALGGWLFISALSSAQLRVIDSQLAVQLTQAVRYLPAVNGQSRAGPSASPAPGEYLIQVIDPGGRVRGASPDTGTAPLLSADQVHQARTGPLSLTQTIDEENTRIAAAPLAGHAGWVAVAGLSLEAFDSAMSQAERAVAAAGGCFVVIAGLGAYWLARAALSPVERLRRQVAALSGADDESGVAVPATRDEIAALAGTMNDLLGRLRRALARQRAFVADASHELRTPLTVLRGELELASRPGRDRDELTAAVHSAATEADRLSRITDDLLLLARSDSDQLTLRPEQTELRPLLARSVELAGQRLAAASLTCRVDVPDGLSARIDADRIRQAVDNLLDNALGFAPAGSVIVLAARTVGPDLIIEVRDAGPGFPEAFLPRAFERFRRPDTGRSRGDGGAGLGLAIVAAIAAAHGGAATAHNAPGGGAVVGLRLPRRLSLWQRSELPGDAVGPPTDLGPVAEVPGQAAEEQQRGPLCVAEADRHPVFELKPAARPATAR